MKPSIAIGIITYKRPQMLNRALKSLIHLIPLDTVPVQILIVDNDENGSAQKIVLKRLDDIKFPLKYFIEKNRGIPFARNRVIQEAIKIGATEIAFFDDDEIVKPDWMVQLYNTYKEFDCDIVAGPVVSIYPDDTPSWALKGKFYDKERFKTGTKRNRASTANILFNIKWFRDLEFRFNETMALSGGSDTHLTKEIINNGGIIKWVDSAVVYEEVPSSRLTIKWLLQRQYRIRLTDVKSSIEQNGIFHTYIFSILNFFKNSALFLINAILSIVLGSEYLIKSLIYSTKALAVIAALTFRHDYEEYKTIHGE